MNVLASLTVAFALVAGTAAAHEARIPYGDLNLSTIAGADTFDARVQAASRRLCRNARQPFSRVSARETCQAAVQRQAVEGLSARAQADYVRSRSAIEL